MHLSHLKKCAETNPKSRNFNSGCTIGHFVISLLLRVSQSVGRPQSLKCGFKKPGKNGTNMFRAVLITGPPGIGKTTSAHLCAKLEGFTPIELNASDARSKKLVEVRTFSACDPGWV